MEIPEKLRRMEKLAIYNHKLTYNHYIYKLSIYFKSNFLSEINENSTKASHLQELYMLNKLLRKS